MSSAWGHRRGRPVHSRKKQQAQQHWRARPPSCRDNKKGVCPARCSCRAQELHTACTYASPGRVPQVQRLTAAGPVAVVWH